MRRGLIALALLTLAAQARADAGWATRWHGLWRNADQRGDALLQQGHASDAAKLYTDPRRKAYAQITAGDYAAAANELKILNDSEANYNRGNALAHAGELQGALDAYDAALKQDPKHQDARHNRDLVAKAMRKQKDAEKNNAQDKSHAGKPQDKNDGQQSSKPDGQQGDQQAKQSDQPGGEPGSKQGTPRAGSPADKAGDKPAGQGQSPEAAQDKPGPSSKPEAEHAKTANDAEQARRDVNATLQPAQQGQAGKVGKAGQNSAREGGKAQTSAVPLTEKQIAQEQWLRSIPDDPGGLLRRKFLIEHLMRQRDAKP